MPETDEVVERRGASTSGVDEDTRATAVLAVLGGVSRKTVARRFGISEGVLDRWTATFIEAGRAGLASGGPDRRQEHQERYLGLVAHELRSPLTMIRGWADLLHHDHALEFVERASQGISTQVSRLLRLADDVLDATSVALGQMSLDRRTVLVGELVQQIVSARSVDPPPVTVLEYMKVDVDVDRFGQVVDNLLENARKHAPGTASITVDHVGAFAEVVVHSAGEPIVPELAHRMFEPFERGRSEADGIGLGLYVCRSLVVAHGGQIGLRVNDDGNHFWVRIPLSDRSNTMTYEFACGDIMPGCGASFAAESEDELFGQVARHAEEAHQITTLTPQLVEDVKGKVRQTDA